MRKVVNYETDSAPSTSSGDESTSNQHHQQKPVKADFTHTTFNYSRIPRNSTTLLLLVPLGKPPYFDDGDYY
jgi:hypothetical protein